MHLTFFARYIAWIALVVALAAWGAVGFLAWSTSSARAEYVSRDTVLEQEVLEQEAALRLRTLARETREAREQLEEIAHAEIVSIIEFVEAAGRDAGVSAKINQVLAGAPLRVVSSDAPSTRSVSLVIEAEGGFAPLMHMAELAYALPLPSAVEQMRFERVPASAAGQPAFWRLIARVRVLTTAEI